MSDFWNVFEERQSEPVRPICPELLAAKMEKIENFEQPRLLEEFAANPRFGPALWSLQGFSMPRNYVGGLTKFSSDLIDASGHLIGTAHMIKLGAVNKYSLKDTVAIFRELPEPQREEIFGSNAELIEEAFLSGMRDKGPESFFAAYHKDWEAQLMAELQPAALRSRLRKIARENLAEYFRYLCATPHVGLIPDGGSGYWHGAPWYFVAIAEALLAFIDARAERLRSEVADTAVTRLVSYWITKARNMKKSVMIIGNSRLGKSTAAKLNTRIDLGSCRLIDAQPQSGVTDLLPVVAEALGIEVEPNTPIRRLRERINYVQRFARLQLIIDEAQFLLPEKYSRNTAPAALNWLRRSVMDQGISAVLICTPQSYLPAKRRFERTTGFAMEQFDGRMLPTVKVSQKELSEADLLAITKVHLPDADERLLALVVHKVIATEGNFVSDVENIIALAEANAHENGRRQPIRSDIGSAIDRVLSRDADDSTPAQKAEPKLAIPPPCKSAAEGLPKPGKPLETLNRDRSSRPAEVPA